MNLRIDNQLPPALARFIEGELRCSAILVVDVGLRDASDAEVWSYASNTHSIPVSKDEDFANMVLRAPTAKLTWVRLGNRRKALFQLFRQMWPRILERIDRGDQLIEIR